MKEQAIRNTLIEYWSVPDECYVVESTGFPLTAGIGDTPAEARRHFWQMMDTLYDDLKNGKVAGYDKPGRPAKGGVDLHVRVRKSTMNSIREYADKLGISQGELVDFMLANLEIFTVLDDTKMPSASRTKPVRQPQSRKREGTTTLTLPAKAKSATAAKPPSSASRTRRRNTQV